MLENRNRKSASSFLQYCLKKKKKATIAMFDTTWNSALQKPQKTRSSHVE
jgi:hypothetical protein